jgi:acetylornithine deacetylase/succinyl-diaminopimelate desuccinylase-like protein
MIAGLHDSRDRIAEPGVYAGVRPVSLAERRQLRCQTGQRHELRYRPARGEAGYSSFERTVLRPALVVQAVSGGTLGSSGPVVIPSRAGARLSMRLVPDQEPAEIGRLLIHHLAASAPAGARVRARMAGGARPVLLSTHHPAMAAAARAVRATWGVPPVLTRSGGTIPIVEQLHRRLGAPVVLLGFGLASDNIHSANERLSLPRFFRGIQTVARFMSEYAA